MKQKRPESPEWSPWNWALSALEEFRRNVGRGDIVGRTDRLSLALVGASQEGKTSVALRLLGVDPEWLPRVEAALRGGRDIGKSSTPVVTIYEANPAPPSDGAFKRISLKVRRARECRPEVLVLEIPAAKGCVARLVDLVGVEAADSDEDNLACRRATEWLYQADVHVFVSGMDHISDLVKTHDPAVARILHFWHSNPDTSLIVLTKAYETAEAMKELSGAKDSAALLVAAEDRCRRILSEELSRAHGNQFPMERLPRVLPVCLKNSQDPRIALAQEATTLALRGIEHLAEKDPIQFRVRAGFALPRVLRRELGELEEEQRAFQQNLEEKRHRFDKEVHKVDEDRKSLCGKLESLRELLDSLRKKRSCLETLGGDNVARKLEKKMEEMRGDFVGSKELQQCYDSEELISVANRFAADVGKEVNRFVEEETSKLRTASSGTTIAEKALENPRTALRKIILNHKSAIPRWMKYERNPWTIWLTERFCAEESREEIRSWALRLCTAVDGAYQKELAETVEPELARHKAKIAKEFQTIQKSISDVRRRIEENEKDSEARKVRQARELEVAERDEASLARRAANARKAVTESRRYSEILQEHFVTEWRGLVRMSNAVLDADAGLSGLASMCALSATLRQLADMEKEGRHDDGQNSI